MSQNTSTTKPRVLIADDHSIVRTGLRTLIECECEVVGTAEDGRALVEAAQRLQPDVILLDISMPLLNGLDAARQLTKLAPESKLIFLTMHAAPTYATEAFRAGASGYLLKRSADEEVLQAIRSVLDGKYYVTPEITKDVVFTSILKPTQSPPLKRAIASLTTRQREVLQLIGEGRSTKEIATILSLSVRTIEFHKQRMLQQLELHSSAELIKFAIAEGLTTPE